MADDSILTLSFPGKTFLVGEYLALAGGPSLVLSTSPRFDFQVKEKSAKGHAGARDPLHAAEPFAAESPAGRFLALNPELAKRYAFSFHDPHKGLGGLGASTAQFAGVWALAKGVREIDPERFDWAKLLTEYRDCAWNGEGAPPSGADLVAQLTGGITWFDGRENKARRLGWSFQNLEFTLVRTGRKLATHEHLRAFAGAGASKAALHDELRLAVETATTAFGKSDDQGLVRAVEQVGQALAKAGLTAPATLELLAALKAEKGLVRAAKGCGAMGADVVLVLHDTRMGKALREWLAQEKLVICGSSAELTDGLCAHGAGNISYKL